MFRLTGPVSTVVCIVVSQIETCVKMKINEIKSIFSRPVIYFLLCLCTPRTCEQFAKTHRNSLDFFPSPVYHQRARNARPSIFIPIFFHSAYLLCSQNPGNLSAREIPRLQATQCQTNPSSFVLDPLLRPQTSI